MELCLVISLETKNDVPTYFVTKFVKISNSHKKNEGVES